MRASIQDQDAWMQANELVRCLRFTVCVMTPATCDKRKSLLRTHPINLGPVDLG